MPVYDALPDKPAFEDSRSVFYNEVRHQRYQMDELVEKAISGNINCNEWLGHDISQRAARIVPEGYRYDRWNHVWIPKGFAYCRKCKKIKPVEDFGKDKRNTGRDGTRSHCSSCEAQMQAPRNRKAQQRTWKQWKRG